MSLTNAEKEILEHLKTNEYVSPSTIENFARKLNEEGQGGELPIMLEEFVETKCPSCGADGRFKWHFLGRLAHPDWRSSWYVHPGQYFKERMKRVLRAGMSFGGSTLEEAKNRGEDGGLIGAIFSTIIGIAFMLPFSIAILPIQTIFSLRQEKAE